MLKEQMQWVCRRWMVEDTFIGLGGGDGGQLALAVELKSAW